MDDNDLIRLANLVDERVGKSLAPVKEDLADVKQTQKQILSDVQTLKGSVLTLEQKVGSYVDSYQENQRNIERLDTRLDTLEEDLGIEPPEELRVPHFAAE